MIYQFVHLTTGLHQVSDEVVCACVCACVRACVRPSMRVCVRVVSQPNHYTLKTVMTVLRNSCILLVHVCFSTFSADECLLVVGSNTHTFPSLSLCVVPRTPAHYHHTMYCSPSLQLLHRLTLLALHRLKALHVSGCRCVCAFVSL